MYRISCLSPVLNLGLPVTTKKVISPEAAANNLLSLPLHPFPQNSISNSFQSEEDSNIRSNGGRGGEPLDLTVAILDLTFNSG